MRAVVQRVTEASVAVALRAVDEPGEVVGAIGAGLCVLVGVTHDDTRADAEWIARKVWNLRVFDDEAGVMNRSAGDVGAGILVVSQFTLYGDATAGRRPSWIAAARPEQAAPLVDHVVEHPGRPRRRGGDREVPCRDAGLARQRRTSDRAPRIASAHVAARPTTIRVMIGPSPRRVYHVSPARSSTVSRITARSLTAVR